MTEKVTFFLKDKNHQIFGLLLWENLLPKLLKVAKTGHTVCVSRVIYKNCSDKVLCPAFDGVVVVVVVVGRLACVKTDVVKRFSLLEVCINKMDAPSALQTECPNATFPRCNVFINENKTKYLSPMQLFPSRLDYLQIMICLS